MTMKRKIDMNKRILKHCTMIVALGLAATQTIASAQEKPGIEGVWLSNVTVRNCQTGAPAPAPIRILYLFDHDGSLTLAGGALPPGPTLRLGSGVGTWRHAQAQTYTSTVRFFVFNTDNTIAALAVVTKAIELNGDVFTATNVVEDFDVNGMLISKACTTEIATRAQ
jgi:hypothetical protein